MPKIWHDMIERLKDKKGVDNPYALSTGILQKARMLKKGTRKLTKKGKKHG